VLIILNKVLFALFSCAIALCDIKTGMVPRIAFILAFPFFFILKMLKTEEPFIIEALTGTLFGLFVFIFAFFISRKKLGLADVWYSGIIGLVFGPYWWYAAMGIACIAGIIYILASKKRIIPFIPLMAFGSIAVIFFQK
jgi:prepilin signal peptidase PulO-like enzyme (type II secretory pathway)